jgi:hypothetical protein
MAKTKIARFNELREKSVRSNGEQDEFLLLYKELVKENCPGIKPQSQGWLDLRGSVFHMDQSHPRVAKIFQLMERSESGRTITDVEAKQFQWETDLLGDEIRPLAEAMQRGKPPVSRRTQAYVKYLASPPLPKPPMFHESVDGVECERCGVKKEFWERCHDCSKIRWYTRRMVRGR